MADLEFSKEITALLVTDPYNEFISAGGKIWDRIKKVAEANVGTPEVNRRTENCARPQNEEAEVHSLLRYFSYRHTCIYKGCRYNTAHE